jgi:hypothetical protein
LKLDKFTKKKKDRSAKEYFSIYLDLSYKGAASRTKKRAFIGQKTKY